MEIVDGGSRMGDAFCSFLEKMEMAPSLYWIGRPRKRKKSRHRPDMCTLIFVTSAHTAAETSMTIVSPYRKEEIWEFR